MSIPLKDRSGNVVDWAFIDDIDKYVLNYDWCLSANGRAVNGRERKQRSLGRDILEVIDESKKWVKHYNGDTLDCRRDNMWILDRENDPTGFRHYGLLRNYGITEIEYNEILEKQNGVCAICERSVEEKNKEYTGGKIPAMMRNLAVDHCHDTNVVRGLLCYDCNTGLGKFKDNSMLLEKAALYLTKFDINNSMVV